ncbi:SDR family oxidoreductase [Hellea balneolensis]|uniref:SDR family oxidoreductase n=1 Tax=Hellea balneolensis TaxID=287478 RepID=UPI000415611B|nr:SDR family oxidoreductase [Hellea balneolensis]
MSGAILITGAGARVGRYLAKGLAADGWAVAIHYNRSKSGAEKLASEISDQGGTAAIVQANLFVPQDLETLVSRASEAIGLPLTALINNASTFQDDRAEDFSRTSYDYHMDINLRAPLSLSQQLFKQLPNDKKGSIINMIDQRVLKPDPTFFTYAMSKSALHWATKTLAQSMAPKIRVNAIGPGPTLKNHMQSDEEFAQEVQSTLLETGSPPGKLLEAVRYLLSASSVTGQMIAVDGGQHLS